MADDSKELNFKIATQAELGGFEQVAANLEKQIGMAKALGKDYSDLAEQLKTVRASIDEYNDSLRAQSAAANDVIEVTKEDIAAAEADAAATDEQTVSKAELREAIHGLGLEFPILDRLVHVVTSSIGTAFASVAGAIAIWANSWRNLNEETERFEFPDVAGKINDVNDAAKAWNGLADAIQRANDNYNSAESAADRATAKIREQLTQQKELLAAEKELALAKLESQKDQMTPQAYAAAHSQIETAFGQADVKADETARRQQETIKANEAANLDAKAKQEAQAQSKLPQTSPQTEKNDEEALKSAIDEFNKKIEKQQKVVDDGQAKLQAARNLKDGSGGLGDLGTAVLGLGTGSWGFLGDVLNRKGLDDPNASQKFEEDQLKDLQQRVADLQKTLDTRHDQIKQRDDLRHAATGDEEHAQQSRLQLNDMRQSDAAANKTEEAVQKIHEQTDAVGQHIDRLGTATAKGLQIVSGQIEAHTQAIESINNKLQQHNTLVTRALNEANSPP